MLETLLEVQPSASTACQHLGNAVSWPVFEVEIWLRIWLSNALSSDANGTVHVMLARLCSQERKASQKQNGNTEAKG